MLSKTALTVVQNYVNFRKNYQKSKKFVDIVFKAIETVQ